MTKWEYIDAINADLPWLLSQRESQGHSMKAQALVFAHRLSQRMTEKELQIWNEQLSKECTIEIEKMRATEAQP